MRRAFFSSATLRRPTAPPLSESPAPPTEYVINWPAIGASLALLLVLVAAPAALFAWRPDWFAFSRPGADSEPLVVAVESSIQAAPPVEPNPVVEELRLRQLREAEEEAVDRSDSTRPILRGRSTPPRAAPEREQHGADDERPTELPVIARNLRLEAAAASPPSRLNNLPEYELLDQLRVDVPELRLDDTGALALKLINSGRSAKGSEKDDGLPDASMLKQLVAKRGDLAGLPFRWDGVCRVEGKRLEALIEVSTTIRRADAIASRFSTGTSTSQEALAQSYRYEKITETLFDSDKWRTADHAPALEQMLQADGHALTSAMVNALARVPGAATSQILARRALYDLSPDVRRESIEALRPRNADEYQDVLTAGFRHPWAPVAMNAADALVELDAKSAAAELSKMLELPPPSAPYRDDQDRWVVRELVKVNHMRNCALCHAPAVGKAPGQLRALIPTPGKPLPIVYYDREIRPQSSGFVRADITYLRQDFSIMEEVPDAKPWPTVQRFDFLVRTRVLPPETQAWLDVAPPTETESPQREALLYALRRLTGQDPPATQAATATP